MIGIILAGGEGQRCYPMTVVMSKQLLPVYDKPMIYYTLAFLLEANIRDVVIITSPKGVENYRHLLKDGSQFGVRITYVIQEKPLGTAHAMSLVQNYIGDDGCILIYGDNYVQSHVAKTYIKQSTQISGATIFAYSVDNPQNYGVIELSKDGKVVSIEEKPQVPKSHYAMIGLICFDKTICDKIAHIKLSERNEFEITDVLKIYLDSKQLTAVVLEDTAIWSDLGDPQRLTELSYNMMQHEKETGEKIGCPEEIALNNKWISSDDILHQIQTHPKNLYVNYLRRLIKNE